jgi:ATP-binding cassette subfamily F protein 3
LLVLDEPTNHLDIPAREALEDALMEYDGTILFVSHDRMFLKKMASRILEIGETSKVYNLNYEEYTEKKNAGTLNQIEIKSNKKEAIPTSQPKGKSFADTKALKNRVAKLESLLEKAEQELEELRELRYEPEYYQDYRKMEELDNTIDEKHNEINALMSEWEEKSSLLEENQ